MFVEPAFTTSGLVRILPENRVTAGSMLSSLAITPVEKALNPVRFVTTSSRTFVTPTSWADRFVIPPTSTPIPVVSFDIEVNDPVAKARNAACAASCAFRFVFTVSTAVVIFVSMADRNPAISSPTGTRSVKVSPDEYSVPEKSISTRAK